MQHGYGVYFGDAKITRPLELIKSFPEAYADYQKDLFGGEESEDSAADWLEHFDDGLGWIGFAPFFAMYVGEAERIELAYEDGYGCVIFPESYPWCFTERERSLTREDVENIFRKWINIVTDDVLIIRSYRINLESE